MTIVVKVKENHEVVVFSRYINIIILLWSVAEAAVAVVVGLLSVLLVRGARTTLR